ncbi:uncharacterized protein LOC143290124 [Babylonia areolata]|uniref:uncharacterized protein LOC143290124 n=1 Tax=Babylonia areolata TaxID=304850 RepID=UPI003FD4AE4C
MELLQFLVFLTITSTCQGRLSLVATPSTLKSPPDDPPRLNMTCSLTPDTADIGMVMAIQLEKVKGTERFPLASVLTGKRARLNTDFPRRVATVQGLVSTDAPAKSFLQLTIPKPVGTDTGTYICVMSYLERTTFLLNRDEATANVTEGVNPNTQLLEELQSLKDQVAQLSHLLQSVHTTAAQPSSTAGAPADVHLHTLSGGPGPQVAFRAVPVSQEEFQNSTSLAYQHVQLNEGQAYNGTTGVFSAPVNGTYVFTSALSVDHGKAIVELKVNGVTKGQLAASGDDQTSQSLVLELQAEDRVWLQGIFASQNSTHIFADGDTVFSGFLLHGY